jgi:hypothetical protein
MIRKLFLSILFVILALPSVAQFSNDSIYDKLLVKVEGGFDKSLLSRNEPVYMMISVDLALHFRLWLVSDLVIKTGLHYHGDTNDFFGMDFSVGLQHTVKRSFYVFNEIAPKFDMQHSTPNSGTIGDEVSTYLYFTNGVGYGLKLNDYIWWYAELGVGAEIHLQFLSTRYSMLHNDIKMFMRCGFIFKSF